MTRPAQCGDRHRLGLRSIGSGIGSGAGRPRTDGFRVGVLLGQRMHAASGPLRTVVERLRSTAERLLLVAPPSVLDKPQSAPGGQANDYYHPAPYWWPNTVTSDGLPLRHRDGERVRGTEGDGSPGNERFDRWALQRMFDETYTLAFAAALFPDDHRFGPAAVRRLEVWFVDEPTAMTPHLTYAQHRPAAAGETPGGHGIIEFAGVTYLCDALSVLTELGHLPSATTERLRWWFQTLLTYLSEVPEAHAEFARPNNRGTWADAQLLAITAWLHPDGVPADVRARIADRLAVQFEEDGSQPHELVRTMPLHYATYNLQAWTVTRQLLTRSAVDERLVDRVATIVSSAAGWLWDRRAELLAVEPDFDVRRLRLVAGAHVPLDHEFARTSGVRPFFALGTTERA